ncbi:MAG: hypothetical protein ACXACU_10600 [Candidatus Hodarchaeales archaeon]|jgi:hypothetical protein
MSVKLINPTKLRTDLAKEIEDYHYKLQNDKLSFQELESLLEKILNERSLILNEYDLMKEKQNKNLSINIHSDETFNLLLNEIDETLYNDFYNLAQQIGYSGPGEVLNHLMKEFVAKYDDVFPEFSAKSLNRLLLREKTEISISHKNELTINQDDLLELSDLGAQAKFSHIDRLEFIDVDIETFKQYVGSINFCNLVRIPNNFPNLLIYAKCHNCSYFEFYNPEKTLLDKKRLEYAKEANQVVEHWRKNGN